ncbi:MAG: hypothetical protein WAM66_09180 [Acidobacteriaceae bacterium]
MKTPWIKGLFAVLVFGAASTGTPANLAFAAASPAGPQQAVPNTPPEAGPNRPANIPDGYVITPFGFFHSSCVQSLTKGERLLADGRIQHADGTVEEAAAVCSYPHYMRGGIGSGTAANTSAGVKNGAVAKNGSGANTPSAIDGWVESASIYSGSSSKTYGALVATWAVPDRPLADDGQVLFFFPGFEDINNTESILQPVLQWNQGQWTIASWNCCLSGIATSSPAINVSAGDEIYGSVTSTCAPGTLACPTWNVLTLDMATGKSTTLADTPSQGQTFNWAFGGVLEAYNPTTCGDYPLDRHLRFDNLTVFDQYLRPVFHPKWSIAVNSTDTPQCHYGIKLGPREVTLDY